LQEKERAVDLMAASRFSEQICDELVSIGAGIETPGLILQSCDRRNLPFLDILIECQLKQVKKEQQFDNLIRPGCDS
jgi:hypothetical protein